MSQENLSSGFPTRSQTNWAVQPQKMARSLKIKEVEGLFYLYSKDKGADQLCMKTKRLIRCVVTGYHASYLSAPLISHMHV